MNLRLSHLCRNMERAGIDVALLLHPRDVLYYAGSSRPASLLVVPGGRSRQCPAGMAKLFVRRALEEARQESSVEDVVPMRGFFDVVETLVDLGIDMDLGVLGTELDTTPAALRDRMAEAFAAWSVRDIAPLILDQRMIKDEDEIVATRRAAAVADAGHGALAEVAAPGLSELELVAEVERAMRLTGHEGYQPLRHPGARGGGMLLMSGENLLVRGGHGLVMTGAGLSAATPFGASQRVVQAGDMMVLDTGSTWHGYTADESRTFVLGAPTPAQRTLFAVASEAEEAVIGAARPGVSVADLWDLAQAVVDQGAPPAFPRGSLKLPGFVGHGIGLELDEPPVLWPRDNTCLREGMVLAIEIEVTAAEDGMMAKMEDTIVVQQDGSELLTQAPRRLTSCG